MEEKLKDHIRSKILNLAECTVNLDVLLIVLYSSKLLSKNEVEVIKSHTTVLTKCFEMYSSLMRRNCYYQLITCLEGSENIDAAKILKASPDYNKEEHSNNSNTTSDTTPDWNADPDFVVTSNGVTGILDVLSEHSALEEHWEIIADSLVTPNSWLTLKKQNNFVLLVFQTLKRWIVDKDKNATFNSLYQVVNKWNPQAARVLLEEKNAIRDRN